MATDVEWIKITTDMFDNKKIKELRRLPDGNNIVLIWVMLLTMAGKCNAGGMIVISENIPYSLESLADELKFEINTVKLALASLERFGMIYRENECFVISNWYEYQNKDGLEKIREQTRERVAKYRERQRLESSIEICQYCGGKATGVDHIIALSRGGKDVPQNRVPCCIECNRIKNDKPLVDFLNNNRERINDSIVCSNETLKQYVTHCNVTDRYNVTQSSYSISNNNNNSSSLSLDNTKDNNINNIIKEIIDYLNNLLGSKYTYKNKSYNSKIQARLKEGFTVDDFKIVIDKKYNEWHDNPDMAQYLTPDTLFAPSKFEKYLNQKGAIKKKTVTEQREDVISSWAQKHGLV